MLKIKSKLIAFKKTWSVLQSCIFIYKIKIIFKIIATIVVAVATFVVDQIATIVVAIATIVVFCDNCDCCCDNCGWLRQVWALRQLWSNHSVTLRYIRSVFILFLETVITTKSPNQCIVNFSFRSLCIKV
mgnify:CR=1 FL=1